MQYLRQIFIYFCSDNLQCLAQFGRINDFLSLKDSTHLGFPAFRWWYLAATWAKTAPQLNWFSGPFVESTRASLAFGKCCWSAWWFRSASMKTCRNNLETPRHLIRSDGERRSRTRRNISFGSLVNSMTLVTFYGKQVMCIYTESSPTPLSVKARKSIEITKQTRTNNNNLYFS